MCNNPIESDDDFEEMEMTGLQAIVTAIALMAIFLLGKFIFFGF